MSRFVLQIFAIKSRIRRIIFLFFSFRPLVSQLAKRNSTKIGHTLGSKCDLKTHVQNLGYPFFLQIGGPQKPPCWPTSQLNGNLNGIYIFGMKHDIRQSVKCVDNYKGSSTSS